MDEPRHADRRVARPALAGGRRASLKILLPSLAFIGACGGAETQIVGPDTPTVASVEVTPTADTLTALGDTLRLQAVARGSSGNAISGVAFTWTSSDTQVLTVTASGLVTATGNGAADITASVTGATASATAAIRVAQAVSGVSVTPGSALLTTVGSTHQFSALASDANQNSVLDVAFVWQSSNHRVATVDTAGLVTARASGEATITASAQGVPGHAALTVNQVIAGLAFRIQPSDITAGGAINPAVQVEVQDTAGNVVEDSSIPVSLALSGGSAGASLSGTTTTNAISGVTNFGGLSVETAGVSYVLVASTSGLPDATSVAFDVSPGTAVQLGFAAGPPGETSAGATFDLQVVVQDQFGNVVPVTTPPVGIELATGPSGGELIGATVGDPADGVVTLPGLWIEKAGDHYSIRAGAGGLEPALSDSFNIEPALPDTLLFDQEFFGVTLGDTLPSFEVEVVDVYGNRVDTSTVDVTLDLFPVLWPGAGLGGNTTASQVGGLATFSGILPDRAGQPYSLRASDPYGLTSDAQLVVGLPGGSLSLSAGGAHTCIGAGMVACWGTNASGQIGNLTVGPGGDSIAVLVLQNKSLVTQVSAGEAHSCAIDLTLTALCWGGNPNGELGDGNAGTDQAIPTLVQGSLALSQISAGATHTCAVSTDNQAYCWGANDAGQLGTGNLTPSDVPVAVTGGIDFVQVSAGGSHTCAVGTDDNVYCWGDNASGQLGDGNLGVDSSSPVRVSGGGATFAYVGSGAAHSCGVTVAGANIPNVLCWGDNAFGQLGDGNLGTDSDVPVSVLGPGAFPVVVSSFQPEKGISVGVNHVCLELHLSIPYADFDGQLACWGANGSGQLGDGSMSAGRDQADTVMGSDGYAWNSVAAGTAHTCALASGAEAGLTAGFYCWGENSSGQLGDGSTSAATLPTRIVQ